MTVKAACKMQLQSRFSLHPISSTLVFFGTTRPISFTAVSIWNTCRAGGGNYFAFSVTLCNSSRATACLLLRHDRGPHVPSKILAGLIRSGRYEEEEEIITYTNRGEGRDFMVCRPLVLKDIVSKCGKGTVCVMRSAVQRLYEICKQTFLANDIFNAVPPPEAQLHRLRSFLDTINPADVGLDENEWIDSQRRSGNSRAANRRGSRHSSRMQARWPPPPVTYLHVYQCNEFSIGIFCLPTLAVLPLHDHPGMIVLSKILYGSMHIKAYDWIHPANIQQNPHNQSSFRLANLKMDTVFRAPCGSSTLYPTTGGNIHRFTAVTSCAVLDILAPPYSTDTSAGRNIAYYREYPYRAPRLDQRGNNVIPDQNFAWLEVVEQPDDLIIRGGQYRGPLVMEIDDESFHSSTDVSEVREE